MFERLAEIDRSYIKSKVEGGYYTSEIEVIRDAVRRLREADEKHKKLEHLRSLVMVGHEQALRGDVTPYTEDFAERAMEQAMKDYEEGKPIPYYVKP